MGENISHSDLAKADLQQFQKAVEQETQILNNWFTQAQFANEDQHYGLELEGCLVHVNGQAAMENIRFLESFKENCFVPELARFNFEYNSPCYTRHPKMFSQILEDLQNSCAKARTRAQDLNLEALWSGILPTLTDDQLDMQAITPQNRYYALTQKVMELRGGEPLPIDIQRFGKVSVLRDNIMIEAAATSLQIHSQVRPSDAVRAYNASMVLSAPCLAIMANSPFLYGEKLWDETRIPVFEQSLALPLKDKNLLDSVTMGDHYIKQSLFELFEENTKRYQTILAVEFDDSPDKLRHLKFLNGQIWRWVRPIVGVDDDQKPHIRLEQRSFPAGPSEVDITANMAFYLGLLYFHTHSSQALEDSISFQQCRQNFYDCAKLGIKAKVQWQGQQINVQKLLNDILLPQSKEGLKQMGIDGLEIEFFIDDIMKNRIRTGWTGAAWQKSFIDCNGKDFQAMTKAYIENQKSGEAVYKWKV